MVGVPERVREPVDPVACLAIPIETNSNSSAAETQEEEMRVEGCKGALFPHCNPHPKPFDSNIFRKAGQADQAKQGPIELQQKACKQIGGNPEGRVSDNQSPSLKSTITALRKEPCRRQQEAGLMGKSSMPRPVSSTVCHRGGMGNLGVSEKPAELYSLLRLNTSCCEKYHFPFPTLLTSINVHRLCEFVEVDTYSKERTDVRV